MSPDDEARPPQPGGLRPRHARRVTPEHVGQRVSVRHLVDDPGEGPTASDVVGRLVAFDEDLLLVVDRAGGLHIVDPSRIVASRVVPPHPRLPPEPEVGTRDAPVEREAARILLVAPDDRVLLVAHTPEAGRPVWTAPGGGVRRGERHEDAARRELAEELGVDLEPGPWVWSRDVTFPFRGVWLHQRERWFLARGDADAAAAPLDDAGVVEARWWGLDELRATPDRLAPERLADHLQRLLVEGPPAHPVDVGH